MIVGQMKRLAPPQQGALRQKATQLLQRRKMYEQQRSTTSNMAFGLEQSQFAIEQVQGAKDQLAVMKTASAALQQ